MSISSKSNAQLIEWINRSGLHDKFKKKVVNTLSSEGFSGQDLSDATTIDDLRDMGFGVASRQLLGLMNESSKQGAKTEQELTREKLRQQAARKREIEKKNNGNSGNSANQLNQGNGFKVKYRNNGKLIRTKNVFYSHSKISEFVTILAEKEIGIAATKTKVIYLSHMYTCKSNETFGDINFDTRVEMTVALQVIGGAAMTEDEKSEIRERFPDWDNELIEPTLDEDMLLYIQDDNLRVKMPCGHVFGPDTIYEIVKMCAEDTSKLFVSCPMVKCDEKWDFPLCIAAGGLNEEEINRFSNIFSKRILANSAETMECKRCGNILERPDDLLMTRVRCMSKECSSKGDFCWICGDPWQGGGFIVCGNKGCKMERVNDILQNCEEKVLIKSGAEYTKKCPVFRACPRCATLVEYDSECKHMKCWGCNKKFCFYCLGLEKDGKWDCNRYSYQCEPAPRQLFK